MKRLKQFFLNYPKPVIHVLAWIFILAGYWFLRSNDWAIYSAGERVAFLSGLLLFPAMFYVHILWIIPFFRQRNMVLIYGFSILATLIFLELLKPELFAVLNTFLGTDINFIRITNHFINGPLGSGINAALGFTAIRFLNNYPSTLKRLRAQNTEMQLAALKSQVDPHFLFNTLNTLYALALEENGEKTASGIATLGSLMRYNLHDSATERISLGKEIDYIQQYIRLQKLRAGELNQIKFDIQLTDEKQDQVMIAPLLFLPLVENAFKFGINPRENSFIKITLSATKGTVSLKTENSLVSIQPQAVSGVGIKNLKDRLNLLYPNAHELRYQQHKDHFMATLAVTP